MMGDILFHLNTTQLDRSGDGFKNYFTFGYHYKYGNGLWFEGMQYPYGDLLMYADAQPSVLLPLKLFQSLGIDVSSWLLGIVQILPILSIIIAGILLHKIMRHYNTPEIWTYITVSACLALSPQLHRFNAHFALGYLFCIPLIWHLLLKYDKQELSKISFALLTALSLLIFGFIHPYHILICALFLLAWVFIKVFLKKFEWLVLLAALIPIVSFMLINSALDPFDGRPENPYGVWDYKTEVSDLLPFYGWFSALFEGKFSIRNYYSEGYAYLGILIFIVPFLFVYQKIKGVKIQLHNSYLGAALLMLLFGMGIHLLLTNKMILEWLPPLKQFRSLGRFSWAFYYVGFISFSAYFYKWVSRVKLLPLRMGILCFVFLFWTADALAYGQFFKKLIQQYKAPNTLVEDKEIWNVLQNNNINASEFQAILPLPLSTEGAEKFTGKDDWFVKTHTIPFAYQTGLPLFGAYMSRTSLPNIFKALAIGGSRYTDKEIAQDINSDKSILLAINKEDTKIFSDITQHAVFIDSTKALLLYKILPSALFQQDFMNVDTLTDSALYYKDYQESEGLLSSGAIQLENDNLILAENVLIPDTSKILTASIWSKIDTDAQAIPVFEMVFMNTAKEEIKNVTYRDTDLKRTEVLNNWIQFKHEINIPEKAKYIEWRVKGGNILFDHALITVDNALFIQALSNEYFIYDHCIAKKN